MNTQYRKNLKDVAIACKNYTDKRFEDFKWELGTHTIDSETDSDVAYQKQAPNGTIGCQIDKLGGMSYKSENIIDYNSMYLENTRNGMTLTNNKDGSYTLSGTADETRTGAYWFMSATFNWINQNIGNGYISMYIPNNTHNLSFGVWTGNTNYNINPTANITATYQTGANFVVKMDIVEGQNYNFTFTPVLVKSQTPPTSYIPYFTGIRDSAVTSVVSKDSNNTTLQTLSIPQAIQNLTGYGWGINDTCYNYIDFENKKFIQKVARVDLGSLDWTLANLGDSSYFYTYLSNTTQSITLLCEKYNSEYVFTSNTNDKSVCTVPDSIRIRDTSYSDATTFKNAMSGVYLYYELATPVETDISQYLTDDDKYIDVEPLGTITFTNTYEQDVPSEITYLTEVAK